ncbi:MAG: hypothetical protein C5S49_07715 [Candidatus Methanogaster sp.]|nr:MAG: hypothetical protein C5S49_07715 [ANME-2 cluster archaeon]
MRCLAGVSYHLSLEAIWEDLLNVVPDHVPGFCGDGFLRLQIGFSGAIAQDLQPLLEGIFAEYIGKFLIHSWHVRNFGVVRATFVNNRQSHTVFNGLAHGVLINVVAKHLFRLFDGGSGVADLGGIRQGAVKICSQHIVLRTVRLVGHDKDVRAWIQFRKYLT